MKHDYFAPDLSVARLTQPALALEVDASTDLDFGEIPDED